MDEYDQILELSDSDVVQLADAFKDELHTELVLGQTRWVCRYGTLSDGHECLTDAQRYYQAKKEMYYLSQSIIESKYAAMVAKADLMDAQDALTTLQADQNAKASDLLRAEAAVLKAQHTIVTQLVSIEDRSRCLDEYNKIRLELQTTVQTQYPDGIEQAEKDNWATVFEYRMLDGVTKGKAAQISNIPLPPEKKLQLGVKWGRLDAAAPKLAIENRNFRTLSEIQQTAKNLAFVEDEADRRKLLSEGQED